jgi:NitT/TauT family transport system ATP-binding protein
MTTLGSTLLLGRAAGRPIIEVKNLKKVYSVHGHTLTVFENLTYRIHRGSFLSIVGPSGCGKTTLLKLISGLELPTGGQVVFDDRAITGPPKGMIYVFQHYTKSIFPWRTVLQNVEFGLRSQKKLSKSETRDRCMDYLAMVGLVGYENYYPSQLSGGMQQRVCIARALICEPDVLLMDEPFSAVDAMTRAILQELLLKIWAAVSVTILFVTHDVEEAVFLSSHIISLSKAPATIKEDLVVDLAYPRDQIGTREDEHFIAMRQRLFSSIFVQEKGGEVIAMSRDASMQGKRPQ